MKKELLHTYFRGETTREEEKEIMDWAESSSENYNEYLNERKLWNIILLHSKDAKNLSVTSNSKTKVIGLWKLVGIAASFTLLIMFSWMFLYDSSSNLKGTQSVFVPAGQRVQLILEDGTKVWLNSNSSLSYPTAFGNKTREVELKGEGYFDVARNEKKPFIVRTHKYDVKVLGTSFNVSAYENGGGFKTSLLHGSVEVSSRNKNSNVVLKEHEEVEEVNGHLYKHTINDMEHFKWKDGLICLNDVPFRELVKRFSLYYDVQIKINNPNILEYRCTGKFRQSDGIDYALRVLQKGVSFKFTRDNNTNTIIIQ